MTIGEKIAYIIRRFEGGNKANFAEKIGLSRRNTGHVCSWLSGKCEPKHPLQQAIAAAYADRNVTVAWLNDDSATLPPETRRVSVGESPMVDQSELVAELRARLADKDAEKDRLIAENDGRIADKDRFIAELERRATVAERRVEELTLENSQLKNDRKSAEGVRISNNSKFSKSARVIV